MAESGGDKGASAATHDEASERSTVGEPESGAAGEEETRKAVQRALEDALLATGLEDLVLCGEGDGEEGCRGACSMQPCSLGSGCEQQVEEEEEEVEGRGKGEERGEGDEEAGEESTKEEEEEAVTEWVDITDSFIEAASLLSPGELVKGWGFSLLDAMSAVELLDPKMDASMHCVSFRRYPRSVAEAAEKGVLQLDRHTHPKLIGIFDEVLTRLATWLNGFTLAQTVFSCLYLLETDLSTSSLLRSFSVGIVKMVDYMREFICRGAVYSEDDQQAMCFGFNMLPSVSDASVAAALKDSEERLGAAVRLSVQADRQRDGGKKVASGETEAIRAVIARIRFVRNLFGLMSVLKKRPVSVVQPIQSHLSQCVNLLPEIRSSCPLGEKLDPEDPLKLGFHPLINHNLLPPSYRHCRIMPRDKGLASLQLTLTQMENALNFGRIDSLRLLKDTIRDFCSQAVVPNVLARSVMATVVIQTDRNKIFGSPSLEDMLKRDAHEFSNPPSLNPRSPLFTSSQGKELTERFFGRSVHPMSELLRLYCQPRARQQEKTERVLDFLADLQHETQRIDQLQNEVAQKIDPARQHLACYASWVLYHLLCLMIDYVVMGFEYNLYSPFEMHYMYWYLEYLYGWLHTSWKTAEKLNADQLAVGGGGKGSKKKGRKLRKEVVERKEREVAVVHVKRLVCVGMMRAFEALIIEEKVRIPEFEHGSQELCFQHRFAAFACIATPHLLTYEDYQQLAGVHNYRGRDINLYGAASRHFSSAKAVLESLPYPSEELQGLLKVIKTNIVIMNLSAKGHKRDSKVAPVLDFSLHPHFPVIRIQ